ncbi:hypothetical protein KC19_VG295100 [Ceratodon purpureus]|uniref:Uncharacterized protein n=1 Tax=Ceratodon purpureus TaxID=3225 RepID=A0A8T0HVG9_CERPU|nr:hypothetical protein KC19_VG295100 [Ceratodon purpureus]
MSMISRGKDLAEYRAIQAMYSSRGRRDGQWPTRHWKAPSRDCHGASEKRFSKSFTASRSLVGFVPGLRRASKTVTSPIWGLHICVSAIQERNLPISARDPSRGLTI